MNAISGHRVTTRAAVQQLAHVNNESPVMSMERLECSTESRQLRGGASWTSLGRWTATVLTAVAFAVMASSGSAAASVATKTYSCGGNLRDTPISGVRGISVPRACAVLRRFWAWDTVDHHSQDLYRCAGASKHPFRIGHPVLEIHSFDGWHLSLPNYGLTLSRGHASFSFAGYSDAPVGCD